MPIINATDLARRTREILDTVASSGESVTIERNHVVIAHLVPPELTMTAAQALAGFKPMLTPTQATAWLHDSRADFAQGLRDPWA